MLVYKTQHTDRQQTMQIEKNIFQRFLFFFHVLCQFPLDIQVGPLYRQQQSSTVFKQLILKIASVK